MPGRMVAPARLAGLLAFVCVSGWHIGAGPEPHTTIPPALDGFPPFTTESARTYLETVAVAFAGQASDQAEPRFIRARFHSYLGQQDQAEHWARAALDGHAKPAEIHLFLSDLMIRQSRLDDAQDSLRAALALNPNLDGAQRRLGMVLDRLGDRTGARLAFEAAVRADPRDANAWLLLGRLLLDEGDVPSALEHLERACRLDPNSANAFYALAQAELRSGASERAQATLRTFQELKRKEQETADAENLARDDAQSMRVLAATLHTEIAAHLIESGRTPAAEQHLRQAISITDDQPLGYETLAAFLLQTGRRHDALGVCQTLVRLRPENAVYRANLGTLLLELQQFPAAVRELERALELDPTLVEAHQNLARFYLGSGLNPGRALELCRQMVKLAPGAAHYDLLAWAFFANGQTAEARAASAQSVALEPGNAVYQQRLRRLQQLP